MPAKRRGEEYSKPILIPAKADDQSKQQKIAQRITEFLVLI